MMSGSLSAASRRAAFGLGLAAVLGVATLAAQQTTPPPAQQPAAPAAAQPADPFKFSGDGGAIFWLIKADKTADFETVIGLLRSKMTGATDKPEVKAAGESYKLFKVNGPPAADGSITYITFIDPASKTTSYSPTWILYESGMFERADADSIYKKLQDSIGTVNILQLNKIG